MWNNNLRLHQCSPNKLQYFPDFCAERQGTVFLAKPIDDIFTDLLLTVLDALLLSPLRHPHADVSLLLLRFISLPCFSLTVLFFISTPSPHSMRASSNRRIYYVVYLIHTTLPLLTGKGKNISLHFSFLLLSCSNRRFIINCHHFYNSTLALQSI